MPKIKYRRLEAGEDEVVTAYGREFEAGEWTDVPDSVLAKARGNPSFEIQGEKSYGDPGTVGDADTSNEEEERRERAKVARDSAAETQKARQAEARGKAHQDEKR